MEWRQEEPNSLFVKWDNQPIQIYRTGGNQVYSMCQATGAFTRTPTGHPEGYIEAFANIYQSFAARLLQKITGDSSEIAFSAYPNIEEGIRGMLFIDRVEGGPISLKPNGRHFKILNSSFDEFFCF